MMPLPALSRFLMAAFACAALLIAPGAGATPRPDPSADAAPLTAPRPLPRVEGERRCTPDGEMCIMLTRYVDDVCTVMERAAGDNALDPNFFARLIWKESLFDASAVSHKGAQGIAQFMPGTAALRGLADPFNPAEALVVSATYLAELVETFGNIGLAAVAYNGGEARAARFIARASGLPIETRDYVEAITGFTAETWRDAPPDAVDLALKPDKPFRDACVTQASARAIRDFVPPPPPWGIVIAANRQRDGAERLAARMLNRHRAVLAGEAVRYVRERRPGMRGPMWHAQLGRQTRADADALCARIRRSGGECMVFAN